MPRKPKPGTPEADIDADAELTKANQEVFLEAFATVPIITHACRIAEVGRRTYYNWIEDEDFARRVKAALRTGLEVLRREGWRRAVEGYEEPVFQGGVEVGTRRRYSDTLLAKFLEAGFPEDFGRARDQLLINAAGGTVEVEGAQHVHIYLPDNNRPPTGEIVVTPKAVTASSNGDSPDE